MLGTWMGNVGEEWVYVRRGLRILSVHRYQQRDVDDGRHMRGSAGISPRAVNEMRDGATGCVLEASAKRGERTGS